MLGHVTIRVCDRGASERFSATVPAALGLAPTGRAFRRELTGAGHRDDRPPGERPVLHEGSGGAFVLDPDGNDVELVRDGRLR